MLSATAASSVEIGKRRESVPSITTFTVLRFPAAYKFRRVVDTNALARQAHAHRLEFQQADMSRRVWTSTRVDNNEAQGLRVARHGHSCLQTDYHVSRVA